jgi:PAS domain S-box-containing protein
VHLKLQPQAPETVAGGTAATARGRAEEQSRAGERRFAAVFQQAAVGMTIASLDHRFEEVNQRFCEIVGYSAEELRQKTFLDITHPDDLLESRRNIDLLISGKIPNYRYEKRFIRKDGSIVWTVISVTLLRDDRGLPECTLAILEDVSERKESELASSRLAAVVESSDDAIISIGLDTIITTWNAGAERMFGYAAEEVIGKSVALLIPAGSEDEEPRIIQRLLEGERIDHYETIRVGKGNKPVNVSLSISPILDRHGTIVGASKILRDITDRKRSEDALRLAQIQLRRHAEKLEEEVAERTVKLRETISELEAFSYSVSHDMRSPLRAMQGYSDALLEDYKGKLDETAQDYLNRIRRAASRMDLLIRDILAYSKVAKGEIRLDTVDLEHVIRDVVQNYEALQPERATIQVESPLPPVLGHEAYLTQIISNYLSNAVKFVDPGVKPVINISAAPEGDMIRLSFRDNGIGVSPDHQKQIFQIFGRVYSEKKFEGTGIGLAIVKKAAERMGGSVGVRSELGQGSEFFVLLRRAL